MAWKTYTPEEREAARAARKEEVDGLFSKISEGLTGLRTSERYREYLRVMSRFHEYSFRNSLLILEQRPDATLVASYTAWKQVHRQVRKGEKGIRILAPITYPAKRSVPSVDPGTGLYERSADGSVRTQTKEVHVAGFRAVSVFDISQTEGRELPEIAQELTGDVADYEILFEAARSAAGVQVFTGSLPDDAYGMCETDTGRVTIREGLSQAQSLKTLLHEVGHWRMHPPGIEYPRAMREVQAESLAFVVSAHFGLDTSDYTFGYLDTWTSSASDEELKESMDIVTRHASSLIGQMEREIERLRDDRIALPDHGLHDDGR